MEVQAITRNVRMSPQKVREVVRQIQAVLAIEDRRYYYHPGIDPIRLTGAIFYSMVGDSRISATSTITQQLVRNVFLPQFEGWTLQQARERSTRRKLLEMWVSLVMSRRATKDEILEMYLNAVPLGQRGSFAIVGVSEAARLFFGKDVSNLSIAEAATMAGVIQSPSALSPFNNPTRCRDRRNVVIRATPGNSRPEVMAKNLSAIKAVD